MTYIRIPFAENGEKTAIPFDQNVDGFVSFDQGYTTDYLLPKTNPDSKNVELGKQNYLFGVLSSEIQQYQQYGVPLFITSADNDGEPFAYAINAYVRYEDVVYRSLKDDNTSLPTVTEDWEVVTGGGASQYPVINPAADPSIQLETTQSGQYFENEGEIEKTFYAAPVPPLDNPAAYTFINLAATGTRFTADGTDTIRMGDQVGSYIETTDIGASLSVVIVNSSWIVTAATGSWVLN